MGKYLWLAVEADEYELPIAVADTAFGLANLLGVNKHSIESRISKKCNGRLTGVVYMKVRNEDDE